MIPLEREGGGAVAPAAGAAAGASVEAAAVDGAAGIFVGITRVVLPMRGAACSACCASSRDMILVLPRCCL